MLIRDAELADRCAAVPLDREPAASAIRRVLRLWLWLRCGRWTARYKKPRPGEGTKGHRAQPRRMAHLDAATAVLQLKRLGAGDEQRRGWAHVAAALRGRVDGEVVETSTHAVPRNVIVILDEDAASREETLQRFHRVGVEARAGYSPLHIRAGNAKVELPYTEWISPRVLTVPIGDAKKTARALGGL